MPYELLARYQAQQPEIVFEWYDTPTGARGWVVINSLRGGAAGGGTRMRRGLNRDEVISLAKVMEIKFSVCGPPIGGAKSGIDFDPADPRRNEVLQRWYKAVMPLLKHYYGTGGDLNVDELKDVIPITEELGLWHPQEGIVIGHLRPNEGTKINVLGQLRQGVSKRVEDVRFVPEDGKRHAVADLITGYGVAESVRHFYRLYHNSNLTDKRVIIQGWGNVASAAACYLSYAGAKIVGIIDINGGIISTQGLQLPEVKALFSNKQSNRLYAPNRTLSFEETNARIWDTPADIFIPGAASKLVSPEQARRLVAAGVQTIACGANVPFTDDGVFFGPTAQSLDRQIALIPDFIANSGMARVFAYLMQPEASLTDEAIFTDVSNTIERALKEVQSINPQPNQISAHAIAQAMKKLL